MGGIDRHTAAPILVVDADGDHCDLVAGHLTEAGISSLRASSGLEAVDVFRRNPGAMILSEMKLPDMEGAHLLKTLQGFDPYVTVIFMARQAALDTAASLIQKGACDLIEKPVSRHDLLAAVRRAALRSSELTRLRTAKKRVFWMIASLPVWFTLGYLFVKWLRL